MSKPLVLQKHGSSWEVYIDVAAARRMAPRRAHKKIADLPASGLVPIVSTGEKTVAWGALSATPKRMTKGDAEHVAHMIGRYKLELGDFVSTYTEERR